jgi:hypothetical protein
VLQRPNNTDRTSARMTVVVFDKRAHLFAPTSAEGVTPVLGSAAPVGSTAVSFTAGAEPAGIRKGSWLLDGTVIARQSGTGPGAVTYSAIRNANFYRVVSVTPNPNGTTVDVELHRPIKPDTKTRFDPAGAAVADVQATEQRQFILLAGVADVFEKTPLANR